MVKCPFCSFDNEDGALFCDQCKSDLGMAEPVAVLPEATPLAYAAEPVEYVSGNSPALEPIAGEAIPVADLAPSEPLIAPMAEIAPGAPSEVSVPESSAAPEACTAELTSATLQEASTVPDAAPITMPASAFVAAAGISPAATDTPGLPADAQPRLLVLRGQKRNVEYPLYEGLNFIGRADEKPVDIDLEDQEPPDRIWCSRQHALVSFEDNKLAIEDLNSANGTFVNRARIYPGQKRQLNVNDVIQIGNVQLKVIV